MATHPRNEKLREEGVRQRMLTANEKLARDNEALIFTLREVHAILSEKTNGLDDAHRVSCASAHVVRALGRYGAMSVCGAK